MLPTELLQQAFFLHALATDSTKVLPPGKSLLAMMARAPPAPAPSALHARVEHVVHAAFWDEALNSLCSPEPAVQLPRLKLLYTDLRDALVPLFPPNHTLLTTLAAPLPPTSSPLHSTLALLQDVLRALRQRCAPARDPAVDTLLSDLSSPPTPQDALAKLITTTLRSIIALADVLKQDLTGTLLGAMSESQLLDVLRTQARTRERELVLDSSMWGSQHHIDDIWSTWLGTEGTWTTRLLRALAASTPVTCAPGDPHPNALPPQLFFVQPTLLYIQNYLQALVVAASLKSLVRLPSAPAPSPSPSTPGTPQDFVSRVWTLLKSEIEPTPPPTQGEEAEDPTKLVHLADEVVRARRLLPPAPSEEQERDLRSAVERTLRLQDPVFALLQGRLVRGVEGRVRDRGTEGGVGNSVNSIPETMRTGRGGRSGSGTPSGRSGSGTPSGGSGRATLGVEVKGFEGEVLRSAVEEVVGRLCAVVEWVEGVWGDSIVRGASAAESAGTR
ncbi:hypothetical protein DXG01_011360 [Tephrocybe rancida]|nr:hypothetical protein DXG01_011360 [Tephrocybe rancida]